MGCNYIPVKELASKLKCSEETIRRLIRSKQLPAIKIGHDYRIDENTLQLSLGTSSKTTGRNT